MKFGKKVLVLSAIIFSISLSSGKRIQEDAARVISPDKEFSASVRAAEVYNRIGLSEILNYDAFEQAYYGYVNLDVPNKELLTIIDFTLPSTDKRLVVVDMKKEEVLFHSIVSHGRNSGEKYATKFSNRHGSYQSSLGFYTTGGTYQGGNGYSLILNGLEKGINDQARARAIVIHGADYCHESFITTTGRLGRSQGCPALPRKLTVPIINTIKNGSLLYIYADQPEYMANTTVLKDYQTTWLAQNAAEEDSLILPSEASLL